MIGDETQNALGLRLVAADGFSHFRPEQIDHHDPSWTDDRIFALQAPGFSPEIGATARPCRT